MKGTGQVAGSWVGYGAALWALIFAAFHIVWATGWYIGLEEEPAGTAFAKRWVLVYDLVVAGICAVAVPVALALTMPWGRRLPRRLLGVVAWGGTGLLVVRAGGSLVQLLYMVATGTFVPRPRDLWEAWFYVGAVLFSLSTWRFWRASRPGPLTDGGRCPGDNNESFQQTQESLPNRSEENK